MFMEISINNFCSTRDVEFSTVYDLSGLLILEKRTSFFYWYHKKGLDIVHTFCSISNYRMPVT